MTRQDQFGKYRLVADSEYDLKPYLVDEIPQIHTAGENVFNESITRTRCVA